MYSLVGVHLFCLLVLVYQLVLVYEYMFNKKSKVMKGKFSHTYKNAKGTQVFVYGLTGTPQELTDYETHKGEHFRAIEESEFPELIGTPAFFTRDYPSDDVKLTRSAKTGDYFINNDETILIEAKIESIKSPALKQAVADAYANQLLASMGLSPTAQPIVAETVVAPVVAPTVAEVPSADEDDSGLGDM